MIAKATALINSTRSSIALKNEAIKHSSNDANSGYYDSVRDGP